MTAFAARAGWGNVPPALGTYLGAALLARIADEGARIALVLLAVDATGSTAFGGLLAACLLIPHVVAAPAMGAVADHARNRARVNAVALGIFGCSLLILAVFTGRLPTGFLLLAALIGGCTGPLLTGGMTSLLRDLTSEDQRERGFALDILTYNSASLAGPAGAALIAQIAGPSVATAVLGISVLLAALLVLRLPLAAHGSRPARLRLRDLASPAAARHMWRDRSLRAATVTSSIAAAGTAALPIALVVIAAEQDNGSIPGVGIFAFAAGGMAGSIAYARRPFGTARPYRTVLLCGIATALPLFLTPLVANIAPLVGLIALAGLPSGPMASSVFLIRDRLSPPALHTQVFTLAAGLKMSAAAAGTALAGFSTGLGGSGLLLAIAIVQIIAVIAGVVITARSGARYTTTA